MPVNNSAQKGSIAIIAALAGIAVLTLGIFAGKSLVSQGPRLNPFAIAPPLSATPTPTLSLTNMTVNDVANAADWHIQNNLQVGNTQYGDRAYAFSDIPSQFLGSDWIQTANDSRAYTTEPLLTFNVNIDVTVYVAHGDIIASKPAWLTSWSDTGLNITNNEATPRVFSLYSKEFTAGQVVVGTNGATGKPMYTVIVLPNIASPTPTPTVSESPSPTPTPNPLCVYCDTDVDCQTGYYCTEEKYCRPSCLNSEPACLMPEPFCPSITPSPTPTITGINLPDLIVTGMRIELETGSGCYNSPSVLGVRVYVKNIGNTDAGQFLIDVNGGKSKVINGLKSGQSASEWLKWSTGPQPLTAIVDATFLVEESNEENNKLTEIVPLPSLPPITCTPTPTGSTDLISGDANEDKTVDGIDYVIWFNHYNQETGNKHKDGDYDDNGKVDGLDYVLWLNQYFLFHPKPPSPTPNIPTPTCVPPPPCYYGIKQPDGTVIYCDPPPYVIFCPVSPTPTCVPPPPCINGVKQPDGTIIYCDPEPWVKYCPVTPTPTPSNCKPPPPCLYGEIKPDGSVIYCTPEVNTVYCQPTPNPTCAPIPESCIKWENGVAKLICKSFLLQSGEYLPWCPVPTCTPRPACLDTPPYCLLMPKLPNYCPPKITPVPNPSCYPLPDYCIYWENGVSKNICRATIDLFWCPLPTCTLRPACLDEIPACEIPEMPYFCPPVITL